MAKDNLDANPEQPSKDKKAGRGKRGALSTSERDYIEKWASTKDIKQISKDIGKGVPTIRKYAYDKNLVLKDDAATSETAFREKEARAILRSREYWNELKQQFTDSELREFEQLWAKLWLQFSGDVLASEELQMKKYITLEIMKDRFGKQAFDCIRDAEKLRKTINEEYAKPVKNLDGIKQLNLALENHQRHHLEFAKQQRETMGEQKDVEKSLRVSRDDRIKSILDATQNWTSIIRLLNENAQVRDEVGRQLEVMRAAKENSFSLLSDFHTFIDGGVDKPILSHDTIGEKNNEG